MKNVNRQSVAGKGRKRCHGEKFAKGNKRENFDKSTSNLFLSRLYTPWRGQPIINHNNFKNVDMRPSAPRSAREPGCRRTLVLRSEHQRSGDIRGSPTESQNKPAFPKIEARIALVLSQSDRWESTSCINPEFGGRGNFRPRNG